MGQGSAASDLRRFHAKVVVEASGCWRWTANTLPNGYGRFWLNGEKRYAHRAAYEMFVGPIPPGLQVDHLCRSRRCVNPAHLEAVSQRVNILRGESPYARRKRQDSCLRGHPFTEANTYVKPNGTRRCKECHREAKRRAGAGRP